MECNRDEALRAKEIAEKKFTEKDIMGAKKFALKAYNLYPTLEGLSQMMATLEVYLAAEGRVNGERDWYAILSVHALADEEMVKKRYRKLALVLHPDKNKSIGAEGAFQLVSEAWSVLSDKNKRYAYDQKRNIKGFHQKFSKSTKDSSVHHTNGFHHFANSTTFNARTQKSASHGHVPHPVPTPTPPKPDTFWTSCKRCKMQYEYLRCFVNQTLLCPNCKEPFLAVETGAPTTTPTNGPNIAFSSAPPQQHQQKLNRGTARKNTYSSRKNDYPPPVTGTTGFPHGPNVDSYHNSNFQWGAFSRMAGAASAAATSTAGVQAASMVQQTYEKVKREREEVQAAARRDEAIRGKFNANASKRSASGVSPVYSNSNSSSKMHARDEPNFAKVDRHAKKRRSMGEDGRNDYKGDDTEGRTSADKSFGPNAGVSQMESATDVLGDGKARMAFRSSSALRRDFSLVDIRTMLKEKARLLVRKKLEDWASAAAAKLAEKEKVKHRQKQKESIKEKDPAVVHGDIPLATTINGSCEDMKQVPGKKVRADESDIDTDREIQQPVSIDVPDPDFHDFDKDRSEGSFEADQIWATYDNEDGMPRYYALVQKVLSLKPFRVRISFLNSKSNSEFSPLNWVGLGFAKTCGDFRVGRYEVNDSVNVFSHKVRGEKGARGVIRIIPHKGETWALYRNWSPDWDEHTPDDVMYKYDMVEVLDDYNGEEGVSITPLVKVAGFKTVFHRHLDPKEVRKVPREEMFRFSHQVPSYLLTGKEAQNAPEGCVELDPAATPLELLQVITEAKEGEMVEKAAQQAAS